MWLQRIIGTCLLLLSGIVFFMGAGEVCVITVPIGVLALFVTDIEVPDEYD